MVRGSPAPVKENRFQLRSPNISANLKLRKPQREGFEAIKKHFSDSQAGREVSVILPVGCGKSGLIALVPFAVKSKRTLVIAPGKDIADQLTKDFTPSEAVYFYSKYSVLTGGPYPEAVELRSANIGDLGEADVVVTNIHQLQGKENRWLVKLDEEYFDLILFDEGRHNVADSWQLLRQKFPKARIVNFSATPARADGQLMAGQIIYTFPVSEAIAAGFIKRLKAVVLNPATLKYVRREDNKEIEVSLREVIELGEQDSDFRRSIVSSKQSLATIVDCSIREMRKLRESTGDNRIKIIASALNHQHCIQITQAYTERNLRAAYVHSKEDGQENKKILAQLENHGLDAIVQVRKLAEGFDHKFLSVAAVCSVFTNLSPFVQFVGRIMRVIVQDQPNNPLNRGTVVFHAGANIKSRWTDFQKYSTADREYFDQLLPLEELPFTNATEIEVNPSPTPYENPFEIRQQSGVAIDIIPLLENDPEAAKAIRLLKKKGFSPDQVVQAMLQPVPTTKQKVRLASRKALDELVKNGIGRELKIRKINPKSKSLAPPLENFQVVKSRIDKRLNTLVGRKNNQRGEFTQTELDKVQESYDKIIREVAVEMLDGKT
jgi:superfamily II DNA or RNA helicase